MKTITRIPLLLLLGLLISVLATACSLQPNFIMPSEATAVSQITPAASSGQNEGVIQAEQAVQDQIILIEEIVIGLLFIATLVGVLTRWLRVPYTVGLVVIGLLLTLLPIVKIELRPNLILALLIPPLVFEGAFNISFGELRRNLLPILIFAIPGVVLTMLVVGGIVSWGTGLPIGVALIFGAVVAAIDPVSVIALLRRMGVPKKLEVILEGESLLNDGTSIVLFGLVIQAVITNTGINLLSSLVDFIRIAGGGVLVGLALGWLISQAISRIDDYLIETTLTTVLAYGSYLIAEEVFHVSGVLAVVAAGLVNGNIGPAGMSPTTRVVLFNFWEYAAFLANSMIFLLIGLQIDLAAMGAAWQYILVAVIGVLIARAVTIYGLAWIGRDIPLKWQHVLNWGGMRGAISLALALSLPLTMGPNRSLLQLMTFGVVVFTLLVQGMSMGSLVRRLGIIDRSEVKEEYERRHARAVIAQAGYDYLSRMSQRGLISEHTWEIIGPLLNQHSQALINTVREVMVDHPELEEEEMEAARRANLEAQRATLSNLLKDGVISEDTYAQLISEVDAGMTISVANWPELLSQVTKGTRAINRMIVVVIQEQDRESAMSALGNLGFTVTHLPSVGGFLGRRNVTLLIGLVAGQEGKAVEALTKSCKQRVEYVATPMEPGGTLPFPEPIPVTVGGATIFVFDVERYEEF